MNILGDLGALIGGSAAPTNDAVTRYYSFDHSFGDVVYNRTVFSYTLDGEAVAGYVADVQFTIEQPAAVVWLVMRDFNLWQNEFGHFYSRAFGDSPREMVAISDRTDGEPQNFYIVEHIIPEHLIVYSQPVLRQKGIKNIGTHVFLLTEHVGGTTISVLMQHAHQAPNLDIEETVKRYRDLLEGDTAHKWSRVLAPTLRKLVMDSAAGANFSNTPQPGRR